MRLVLLVICVLALSLSACPSADAPSAPAGMIAMFEGVCPQGWTRYAQLDGRFARGAQVAGGLGGEPDHVHSFDITARTSKDGNHVHMLATGEKVEVDSGFYGHIGIEKGYLQAFEEGGRVRTGALRARAVTDTDGAHDHLISVTGDSEPTGALPPYLDLIFCKKD